MFDCVLNTPLKNNVIFVVFYWNFVLKGVPNLRNIEKQNMESITSVTVVMSKLFYTTK